MYTMTHNIEGTCVICTECRPSEKIIIFTEHTLKKSGEVLEMRKQYALKYGNVTLPAIGNLTDGYHSCCYKNFLAVNKKYRQAPSANWNGPSSSKGIENANVQSIGDPSITTAEDDVSVGNGEDIPDVSQSRNEGENANIYTNTTDVRTCVFCNKTNRKFKGRIETLRYVDRNSLLQSLAPNKKFIEDSDIYKKIESLKVLSNHRICRKTYFNKLRLLEVKPETEFRKNLALHKAAFQDISHFVKDTVIDNKTFVSFSSLCNRYINFMTSIALEKGEIYDKRYFSRQNLEKKLKEKYKSQLQIKVMHHKKIFGPARYVLSDEILQFIEQKDIIQDAAQILRRTILDMDKKILPPNLQTSDLLAGECTIPQILKDFYLYVLRGSRNTSTKSNECDRKSNAMAEDLIFNVSKGKIKPSKHITLAMTLKSITSSRKVVEIINRYGHCCSYHTIEELETEATYSSCSRSITCPEGIVLDNGLYTAVAFDNFDRFVDTATGKNTLHDTVGIIYQNFPQPEHLERSIFQEIEQEDEYQVTCEVGEAFTENAQNNRQQRLNEENNVINVKRKRRRQFDEVTRETKKFCGKLRMTETLLPASDERRAIVPVLQNFKTYDVLWMMSHALKIPNTPMWVGFNSKFIEDNNNSKQKICYLTPINESPTDKSVVLETLRETQKIAEEINQSEIEVTYDLAIAKIAMQIQASQKPSFDNIFIHLGTFHIMLAYFKGIGKFIAGCGLMNVAVESGIIANGSVDAFISGKHFNRCKRLHPLMALSLDIMNFQFFLNMENITITENVSAELKDFNEKKLSYNELVENSETSELIASYIAHKDACLHGVYGKTVQFYMIYVNLVNYYQMLSRSVRSGNFALFLYILPKINNLFFVSNQPNYARWLVKYHENLLKVGETHPKLKEAMEKGYFGIKRTDKAFSRQPIDLTLEQTINAEAGRRLTGVMHFTNSISARQRWCKSHEIRSTVISSTYETTGLRKRQDVTADLEKCNIRRDTNQIQMFIDAFTTFLNPFDRTIDPQRLFNISSGKAASEEVEKYLSNIEKEGEQLRLKFISECNESADRFEKPIKRVKIMNFCNEVEKKHVKSGSKVKEIQIQRDMFGRMLGLSMDYDIDFEKILCFPITPIPMSMCRIDGTIYQTDKSAVVKYLEKLHSCGNVPNSFDVVIFDGFFLLHTMQDIPATFGNISKKIMKILTATGATRVDIIFDQYFTPSIKDYERNRRNEQSTIDFNITGASQTRPTDFLKGLKNIKFKQSFVKFLIEHWSTTEMTSILGCTNININYDVCYSYSVRNGVIDMTVNDALSCQSHEEADTKIVYHLCHINANETSNVLIRAGDTDVLVIMLGNMDHLQSSSLTICMEYGTGNNRRYINITELHRQLGQSLCASLPGYHALTGCDYNPAFFKKGKIRPLKILMTNREYQKAFNDIAAADGSGSVTDYFNAIQKFVCEIYGFKDTTNLNTARFNKFCATYTANSDKEPFKKILKNYDPSTLPPCQSEFKEHLSRTKYITSIWRNANQRIPTALLPEKNGWERKCQSLQFHWFTGDCLPQSVADALVDKNAETGNDNVRDNDNSVEDDDEEDEEYLTSDDGEDEDETDPNSDD